MFFFKLKLVSGTFKGNLIKKIPTAILLCFLSSYLHTLKKNKKSKVLILLLKVFERWRSFTMNRFVGRIELYLRCNCINFGSIDA